MSQVYTFPELSAAISLSNYALESGGNLEAIKNILDTGIVEVTGDVNVISSVLPTGAATEATLLSVATSANEVSLNTLSIDAKTPALVSGRVPVDGSGVTQPISAASLPLPTGAATETTLSSVLTSVQLIDDTVNTDATAAGTKGILVGGENGGTFNIINVDAQGHVKVDIAASSSPVAVTQSGTWNINNISGTVSLPTGAATESTLSTLNGKIPANLTVTSTRLLVDGSGVTQPVSGTITQTASSSSVTSVASSATSVSVLASNSSRRGATFYNDSTQICYLKLGTTASSSSYTVQLAAGAYYELPPGYIYTGAIDAIWASANGNLRVTELS